ncbi:MAG: beta-D-galactosidase [Clostridia bacterium]|jgi:YhcH/YjgK/YiaL family protein|nr:beta-D-galactosidase [Clostridia bacterium]
MIWDKLDNINQYRGKSKNLDCAIDFLMNLPIKLEVGKVIIDNDNVFANIMAYSTKDVEEGFFEAHRQYIDIHVMLVGEEKLLNTPIGKLEEKEIYNIENDCVLYKGQADETVTLTYGYFALCLPEDGHMPGIAVNEKEVIKKMVIKVKLSEEE